MADITKITAQVATGDDTNAGTFGWVYLGIGGREFVLTRPDIDDMEPGSDDTYILGDGANVEEAQYNDPRTPQLNTDNLSAYPAYIRLEPEGQYPAWQVERVTVVVNPDGPDSITFDNLDLRGAAKIWLGQPYGKTLYLQRETSS
ncbi:hypothetical protein [Streptomyces sp. NPDC016845]|uniref:hypothetical protein n=1 Tax=Streptomyces sp. NPDC016845 TaxID=3364972 RepID=UPI003796C0D8